MFDLQRVSPSYPIIYPMDSSCFVVKYRHVSCLRQVFVPLSPGELIATSEAVFPMDFAQARELWIV